jgi:hypothetical protein
VQKHVINFVWPNLKLSDPTTAFQEACSQEHAEQQAKSSLSTTAISVGIFVALVVA